MNWRRAMQYLKRFLLCLKALTLNCDVSRAWWTLIGRQSTHEVLFSNVGRGKEDEVDIMMQEEWILAGKKTTELLVRTLSGNVVLAKDAVTPKTRISTLIEEVSEQIGAQTELLQLCSGTVILKCNSRLGDGIGPPKQGPLELTILKRAGPAVKVEAMSGRNIKILDHVPAIGDHCHCDRNYYFTSLGDFANKPGMWYLFTSNDDKMIPVRNVMWKLELQVPAVVHLNFRSEWHIRGTGATVWLERDGWKRSSTMKSTVSTGVPNGPYSGPIYSKPIESGTVELMGSNCQEGTYFVFLELEPQE